MIFQSLVDLYDRLEDEMPPYGFSVEDICFVVHLDNEGNMIGQPEDLRTKISSTAYNYKLSAVPYSNKVNVRSSSGAAKVPNFMVDKADYIFGMSGKSKKAVHRNSFTQLVNDVCNGSDDAGVKAVASFLAHWNPNEAASLRDWREISGDKGKFVAFKIRGDDCFVHERPMVKKLWTNYLQKENFPEQVNFIDGKKRPIQLQYAQFKFGSGASLVSFNEVAYESYGKKKGANAPISVEGEFKSAAALKFLFRSKEQRIRIGDATTVFWAQKKSEMETFFGTILNPKIEDDSATKEVQQFLKRVLMGSLPLNIEQEKDIQFYILGLSLNKARLALRFWHVCTVADLMERLTQHFEHLAMERSEKDLEFPGIWHLLKETARETKDISPVLGGALTRSILSGQDYPQLLYQGVMSRIRADRRINYLRAAIIKAVLQRNHHMEVTMSLDIKNREPAYLLGRLFAVLEKAQLDALGKVKATIKDRFFSAASATPGSVFPRLIRLSQHHIEKAEYGYVSDRRIAEIMEYVSYFPAHMNLQEQGIFAIGYYHQKNDLYRTKENKNQGELQ